MAIFYPGYWKRLINRAVLHASLQRHNDFLVRQLHQAVHSLLAPGDSTTSGPRARDDETPAYYGCLQCRMSFLTKAGEGAHMCRAHGHLAQARGLFDGTACPCCLKEYHSHSRVLAHLRVAHRCRRQLVGRRHRCRPVPGQGSLQDRQLLDLADGAVPFLQASGPLLPSTAEVDFLDYDLHFYEAIYEYLVDLPTFEDVYVAIQEIVKDRPISWTRWASTLRALIQDLDPEAVEGLPGDLAQVRDFLHSLLCPERWQFRGVHRPPALGATASLYAWEMWAYEFADAEGDLPACDEVPRNRFKQRVLLHAFSGRRRPGDVEWYLDALTRQHPECIIFTVSLDIIIHEIHGDVARSATRARWLQAIRAGFVIGFMGGPPCNTWSRARQVAIQGRPGPRVLRLADAAWGRPSLRISELRQVILGNLLLGFALECFTLLAICGGLGFIEHPRAPEEEHMVSIWKLPLVHAILTLPRVRLLHFAQGLLGAPSAKPTTLMVVGMESLESELHRGRMCASNPHGASVGRDEDGNFRTAPLKEYPPGMCRAVSLAFFQAFRASSTDTDPDLPSEFCNLVQHLLNCGGVGSCKGGTVDGPYQWLKGISEKGTGISYETANPYVACSSDSSEGFCPHVDTSCKAANVARTCGSFSQEGGPCTGLGYFPNATITDYGSISGPALPTGIGSSRLRSGSAHWDLELADEVRQFPLRSGAGDKEAEGERGGDAGGGRPPPVSCDKI
eukprot:s1387_g11.t1